MFDGIYYNDHLGRTQPDGLSKAENFFIDKPKGTLNGFSTTIRELITGSFHSFSQIFTNSLKPTHSANIFFFFHVSHTACGGFPRDVAVVNCQRLMIPRNNFITCTHFPFRWLSNELDSFFSSRLICCLS